MKFIAAILSGVLVAVLLAVPAQAARYVYIQNETASAWPVLEQLKFVDQYTGSILQYRACRYGVSCIKVRERVGGYTGFSGWSSPGNGEIWLNPKYRNAPLLLRRNTVAHEMWHVLVASPHHYTTCTNIMYFSTTCPNGQLKPHVFTPWSKWKLSQS